jgi:hypothetical protein
MSFPKTDISSGVLKMWREPKKVEAAKREGVDLREEIREGGVQDKSGVVRVLEGSREWISREGVWKSESKREVMKDFRKGEGEGSQRIASMNLGCGILWILGGSVRFVLAILRVFVFQFKKIQCRVKCLWRGGFSASQVI